MLILGMLIGCFATTVGFVAFGNISEASIRRLRQVVVASAMTAATIVSFLDNDTYKSVNLLFGSLFFGFGFGMILIGAATVLVMVLRKIHERCKNIASVVKLGREAHRAQTADTGETS